VRACSSREDFREAVGGRVDETEAEAVSKLRNFGTKAVNVLGKTLDSKDAKEARLAAIAPLELLHKRKQADIEAELAQLRELLEGDAG